jgi:hypothetical protein
MRSLVNRSFVAVRTAILLLSRSSLFAYTLWLLHHALLQQGVFDHARTEQLLSDEVLAKGLPGLRVLVVGDVPPGGGLSSSR